MTGLNSFNPARLTLARKRRGFSKTKLALAIDVELRTVSAWENGEFVPDPDRLPQIAAALRFPSEFFIGDDLPEPSSKGASFRSFARMTAGQRNMALGAGAIAFVLNEWIEKQFELPAPEIPNMGQELGPSGAAESLRQLWGLGELPVKNMLHLLESKGIRVFSLAIDAAEVDAFSIWHLNRPFIFLNTMKSAERSRMDAAHELGHLVLHRHGSPQGQAAESEANEFASAFLMPRRNVIANASAMPTIERLLKEKKYWGVSIAALAYRLSALRLITEWQYRSLFIEIAKRGYRSHEPDEMQRETSQVLEKVFASLRQDGVTKADVASKLHLPSDEVDALVFGLALSTIEGGTTSGEKRGILRVVRDEKDS